MRVLVTGGAGYIGSSAGSLPTHERQYRADIDGLRAVAVMAVVLHHLSASWVPGGFVGVDVFFVISGYLITKILKREIQEGTFTFARFYERRIRRLFPALFTVLAFVLIAGWFILLPSDYLATFRAAAGTVLFSANIVFWRDLAEGYFAADAKINPLLHMWSLGVEEQFYLVFPVVLVLIHRYAQRWLVPALVAGLLLSLGLSAVLTPIKSVASYFLLPTRAWEMLAGSLLAAASIPQPRRQIWRELLAVMALLAIVGPAFLYSEYTEFPGYAAVLPVAGTVVLIWLGAGHTTHVGYLLQLRPVVYIGLISYSLYLWHWPLIVFARLQSGLQPIDQWLPMLLALSMGLAALSHRFIEARFRKSGTPTQRPKLFAGAVSWSALLLLVSFSGIARDGFEQRVSSEVLAYDKERSPEIPFRRCDGRADGCHIGSDSPSEFQPSILFWGDSHMLAWAPVIDAVLKEKGIAATLKVSSACPPVFGVENKKKESCRSFGHGVKESLESGELDVVIMAAYWSTYSSGNPFTRMEGGGVITDALPQTLQVIQDRGVDVRLIEPLPAYEWNVPVVRAVSAMRKKSISIQTREQHLGKHQDYFTAADGGIGGSTISISERLCSPDCLISNVDGEGLYRDGHHLSVAGALWFRPEISELVERIVLSGERRDGPVSETGHAAGSQVTGDAVK